MPRAIVTYSRGWQALTIIRSLGRQGIEVFCGEEAPFAPGFFSKYCKGSFQYPSPNTQPDEFIDFMVEKVKELKPEDEAPYVLVPVHKETWLFAQHRERFEPHIRLAMTGYENMALVHDKGRLASLAEDLGIRIPPTFRFTDVKELYAKALELAYPVFVKVREGASGVGIKKAETPEELVAVCREFIDGYGLEPDEYPIVQEFVEGNDYCVSALFDHGKCVARMTYHNVLSYPRETGAGALRETVSLPEAEEAAAKLLSHLNWHGIAEFDFRQAEGCEPYLIEVNPRFYGGLHQSVASNVDYPHLYFRIACGEAVETPEVDYEARTEAPVVSLLATLDEIAHDEERLAKLAALRQEGRKLLRTDLKELKLRPFLDALKDFAGPGNVKDYLKRMFEVHSDTIDDVLQRDDPKPALGVLYPLALMLKHGKLSMGVVVSEEELTEERPRRSLRTILRRPGWRTIGLTGILFAIGTFLAHWSLTADHLGWILGWPGRLTAKLLGNPVSSDTLMDPGPALKEGVRSLVHVGLNFILLYLIAALILREAKDEEPQQEDEMSS